MSRNLSLNLALLLVACAVACSPSSGTPAGGSKPSGPAVDASAPAADLSAPPADMATPPDLASVGACKLNATMDQLVNLDDSPPNDGTPCGLCLSNSLAAMFKSMCMGTQYCNPPQCASANSACLGDPDSPGTSDLGVKLGCSSYIDCLNTEYQSNGGNFNSAEMTCKMRAKSTAVTKWETAVACGQMACLSP
jgi:hypothetical protein